MTQDQQKNLPDLPEVKEVCVPSLSIKRFDPIVGDRRAEAMHLAIGRARSMLASRVVWHVNSTAAGGGVAEMLQTLLGYARGAGIDARWLVVEGDPEFFAVTKRIHNGLHGSSGDGGPLGPAEQSHYAAITAANAASLLKHIHARDIVVLHDPQTAGLVRYLMDSGATVIWRCHIGHDTTDPIVKRTWQFLHPHLVGADGYIFTRAAYVPPWLNGGRIHFIPPSIDVFATKNQVMKPATVRAILHRIGLLAGEPTNNTATVFTRNDGTAGEVVRSANIMHSGSLPAPAAPLAVQVSRWDHLKDMLGVMHGFAGTAAARNGAYLALVGPDVYAVTDDPEGAAVYAECVDAWKALPRNIRDQVLLVLLPMDDIDENAAMVNAIQRHASVVIQKSLHEGFGLTVTEAMWKGRPIVASAVGGIADQITHNIHGLIVEDPTDLEAFGAMLDTVLGDRTLARRLGRNARRRCVGHFLGPRHLTQYIDLFGSIFDS